MENIEELEVPTELRMVEDELFGLAVSDFTASKLFEEAKMASGSATGDSPLGDIASVFKDLAGKTKRWEGVPTDVAKGAFVRALQGGTLASGYLEGVFDGASKARPPGKWPGLGVDALDAHFPPTSQVPGVLKNRAHVAWVHGERKKACGGFGLPVADPAGWFYDACDSGFRRRQGQRDFGSLVSANAFNEIYLHMSSDDLERFRIAIPKVEQLRPVFTSREPLIKEGDRLIFNTYIPSDLVPTKGSPLIYILLCKHLVGGRKKSLRHLLQTLAAPLQSLDQGRGPRIMGFYELFFGHTGSGKDTLMDALRLMYGKKNVKKLDQDALDSKFNSQIKGKLVLHLNETISSTNRTMETSNKIKEWTTAEEMDLEAKGKDREGVECYHNLFVTSNSERPIILEFWDRRANAYFVQDSLPADLATALRADLGTPAGTGPLTQLMAFFHYLLHDVRVGLKYGERDPDNDNQRIINQSLPPQQQFVDRVLRLGWLEVVAEFREVPGMSSQEETFHVVRGAPVIDAKYCYGVFEKWCRANGYPSVAPKKALKSAFEMMLRKTFAESRPKTKERVSFDAWHGIPLVGAEPADEAGQAGEEVIAEPGNVTFIETARADAKAKLAARADGAAMKARTTAS